MHTIQQDGLAHQSNSADSADLMAEQTAVQNSPDLAAHVQAADNHEARVPNNNATPEASRPAAKPPTSAAESNVSKTTNYCRVPVPVDVQPRSETVVGSGAATPASSEHSAATQADTVIPAATPIGELPTELPNYRMLYEIARGGMGRVLAAQDLVLDRKVAIKTLLPKADARRFVTEAKITAQLPHPSIPPVYSLGRLADGTHFLVMKLIRGRNLADLLRERQSLQEDLSHWLQVFEQVAQAVGFAHAHGIIHRDLKPQNIMVGELGEVLVMDWGLAKQLAAPELPVTNHGSATTAFEESDAELTAAGTVMGTPGYMAPEQARGEIVDARADVFALGGILTVILTNQPVFVGGSGRDTISKAASANLAETFERLDGCQVEPQLLALAKRCLAPNPEVRPADARLVAEEIANFRLGVANRLRAAEAERTAAIVREQEKKQRRRQLFWAACLVTVILLGGIIGTTRAMMRAQEAHLKAAAAESSAQLDKRQAQAQSYQSQRQEARLRFKHAFDLATEKGMVAIALHQMLEALEIAPDPHSEFASPYELAFEEVIRTNLAAWLPWTAELRAIHPCQTTWILVSRDGRWVANAHFDDTWQLQIWDMQTGQLHLQVPGPFTELAAENAAFSPDSQYLAVVSIQDGKARERGANLQVWHLATANCVFTQELPEPVGAVTFHPDSQTLLIGTYPESTNGRLFSLGIPDFQLRPVPVELGGRVQALSYSPDQSRWLAITKPVGDQLAQANQQKPIRQFSASGKPLPAQAHFRGEGATATYSPQGQFLLSGDHFGVYLWDSATGRLISQIGPPGVRDFGLAGQILMDRSAGRHGQSIGDLGNNFWDLRTGRPCGENWAKAFSRMTPSGELIVRAEPLRWSLWRRGVLPLRAASAHNLPIWDLPDHVQSRRATIHYLYGMGALADIRPDQQQLIWGGGRRMQEAGLAVSYEPQSQRPIGPPLILTGVQSGPVAFRPDGQQYAVSLGSGRVGIFEAATAQLVGKQPIQAIPTFVWSLAYSPDSRQLAVGHNGTIAIWDCQQLQLQHLLQQNDAPGRLVYRADGQRLAACNLPDWTERPGMQLWNPITGEQLGPYLQTRVMPLVRFSPDGKLLLVLDEDGIWRLDAATGTVLGRKLSLPNSSVVCTFLGDGTYFATATRDGHVQLWETATGDLLPQGSFPVGNHHLLQMDGHPDGKRLLVAFDDNSFQLWDWRTHLPLGPRHFLRCDLLDVQFTPDGQSIRTTTIDGEVSFWPLPTPLAGAVELLVHQLEVRTGLRWQKSEERTVALSAEEWQYRRATLSKPFPTPPSDDAELARAAEQESNTFAARWHLNRLLAETPTDSMLWLRRAQTHALDAGMTKPDQAERRDHHLQLADADYQRAFQVARTEHSEKWAAELLSNWYRQRAAESIQATWWQIADWYLRRAALLTNDPNLHAERALYWQRQQRWTESAAEWERAVQAFPERSDFRQRWGEALVAAGQEELGQSIQNAVHLEFWQRLYPLSRDRLGLDHPLTYNALINSASLLLDQGEAPKVRPVVDDFLSRTPVWHDQRFLYTLFLLRFYACRDAADGSGCRDTIQRWEEFQRPEPEFWVQAARFRAALAQFYLKSPAELKADADEIERQLQAAVARLRQARTASRDQQELTQSVYQIEDFAILHKRTDFQQLFPPLSE